MKKEAEKIDQALETAISGLAELSDSLETLIDGNGKKAALQRVMDYVRPASAGAVERWNAVKSGLKARMKYGDLKSIERQRLTGRIRYLRGLLGIVARKRKTVVKVPPTMPPELAEASGRVILPELAVKNQNGRKAMVLAVLTALDQAFGCERKETLALIASVGQG